MLVKFLLKSVVSFSSPLTLWHYVVQSLFPEDEAFMRRKLAIHTEGSHCQQNTDKCFLLQVHGEFLHRITHFSCGIAI